MVEKAESLRVLASVGAMKATIVLLLTLVISNIEAWNVQEPLTLNAPVPMTLGRYVDFVLDYSLIF